MTAKRRSKRETSAAKRKAIPVTPLGKMLTSAGMTRAMVIDDAFDIPAISREQVNEFALGFAQEARHHNRLRILGLNPDGGAHAADAVAKLWAWCRSKPGSTISRRARENLFGSVNDRLAVLEKLTATLKSCSLKVLEIGAHADIPDVGGLVFLDYYLDSVAQRQDASSDAVGSRTYEAAIGKVRTLYQRNAKPPFVILISDSESIATSNRAVVCKTVGELGGFFGFIRKADLHDETILCLKLAELGIGSTPDAVREAVRDYAKAVAGGVTEVAKDMGDFIFSFELQDYVHLQNHSLNTSGDGLGEYMQTLLEAKLGHLFSNRKGVAEKRLALDQVQCTEMISTHSQPSNALLDAYHCSQTEAPSPARPRRSRRKIKTSTVLREPQFGDIYLNEEKTKGLLVVSPSCNLVVSPFGGERSAPAATYPVHLIEGTVVKLNQPTNEGLKVAWTKGLMVGSEARHITWNLDRARTVRYANLPGHLAALKYAFFCRLRGIFALAIQRKLLDYIGRIGLPVVPPITEVADAQIHVGTHMNTLVAKGARLERTAEIRHDAANGRPRARLTTEGVGEIFRELRSLGAEEGSPLTTETVDKAVRLTEFWMQCTKNFDGDRPGHTATSRPEIIVSAPQSSGRAVAGPFVVAILPRA